MALSHIWNLAKNEWGKNVHSATRIEGIKYGRILQTLSQNILILILDNNPNNFFNVRKNPWCIRGSTSRMR